jgi:hypothetical protein
MLLSGVGYSVEKASVLWDTVICIRFCCGVAYNRRKTPGLWDINRTKPLPLYPAAEEKLLHCVIQRKKFVSHPEIVVRLSHNGKKFFHCIPQHRKTFFIVSHNARNVSVLYPTTAKNLKLKYIHENKRFSKII